MAIKNTKLGGTDFNTPSDRIKPTDLNDTFDVIGDVTNKALGSLLNDTAQNIFNAAYLGFDAKLNGDGSPNLDKVDYDIFSSDSMTGGFYDGTNEKYLFIGTDDLFDDASIDANLWTTVGSVTEASGYIKIQRASAGTSTLTSDGTTGLDYDEGVDQHLRFRFQSLVNSAPSPGTAEVKFGLTDGVATVWLETQDLQAAGADDSLWDVYIDNTAETVDTYNDGVLDTASIDISSITGGNYYFVVETVMAGTGDIEGRVYYLASNAVGDTVTITSAGLATGVTVDKAIPIYNEDSGGTLSLSADGSTFESVTNRELHRFTVTGTNIKVRAAQTIGSISVPTTLKEWTEYLAKYNLY